MQCVIFFGFISPLWWTSSEVKGRKSADHEFPSCLIWVKFHVLFGEQGGSTWCSCLIAHQKQWEIQRTGTFPAKRYYFIWCRKHDIASSDWSLNLYHGVHSDENNLLLIEAKNEDDVYRLRNASRNLPQTPSTAHFRDSISLCILAIAVQIIFVIARERPTAVLSSFQHDKWIQSNQHDGWKLVSSLTARVATGKYEIKDNLAPVLSFLSNALAACIFRVRRVSQESSQFSGTDSCSKGRAAWSLQTTTIAWHLSWEGKSKKLTQLASSTNLQGNKHSRRQDWISAMRQHFRGLKNSRFELAVSLRVLEQEAYFSRMYPRVFSWCSLDAQRRGEKFPLDAGSSPSSLTHKVCKTSSAHNGCVEWYMASGVSGLLIDDPHTRKCSSYSNNHCVQGHSNAINGPWSKHTEYKQYKTIWLTKFVLHKTRNAPLFGVLRLVWAQERWRPYITHDRFWCRPTIASRLRASQTIGKQRIPTPPHDWLLSIYLQQQATHRSDLQWGGSCRRPKNTAFTYFRWVAVRLADSLYSP